MTGNEVVLVALPQQHDRVWDVSSEDVPHMTLLYLGEPDWTAEQYQNVIDYVEHATGMLSRFGMSVDHRGTLGDLQADVLFFAKWSSYRDLVHYRNGLLANDNISAAYGAVEQFPEWTPHLTLGYPDKPAKEDDREYEIGWVEFDRIALWTADSSGPTFDLKAYDHEVVAMSDGKDAAEKVLQHYGVKGMKWGVRKRSKSSGGNSKPDTRRTRYSKAPGKLSDTELRRRIQRMEMERRYNQLNRPEVSEGRRLALDILTASGRVIATNTLQREGTNIVREALERRR